MKKNILIISLIIFIITTILVLTGNTTKIDETMYDLIITIKDDILTSIMKAITILGNTKTITIFNIILVIFIFIRKKYNLLIITGTSIASGLLNSTLKRIIRRVRPSDIALISQGGFSYPSGHTMISILFYGTTIYMLAKSNCKHKNIFIIIFTIIAILIPISRIYLGVHYFSDIIGGLSFGLFILTTTLTIYEYFYMRRKQNESTYNRSK